MQEDLMELTPEELDDFELPVEPPVEEAPPEDAEPEPLDKRYGIDFSQIPENIRPEIEKKLRNVDALVTRKTQELADAKHGLEEGKQKLEWFDSMEQLMLNDKPAARKVLQDIMATLDDGTNPPAGQPPAPAPGFENVNWQYETEGVRALAMAIANLYPQLNQTAHHVGEQRLQVEMAKLKEELGEFDEKKVLAEARQNPNTPLKYIAIANLYPELEKRTTQKVYENIRKKKETNAPPPAAASEQKVDLGKKPTMEECFQAALKQHKMKTLMGE